VPALALRLIFIVMPSCLPMAERKIRAESTQVPDLIEAQLELEK
jgi:hypothetical protein